MVATLCLLTGALLPAQIGLGSGWVLTPRLGRGQELVYSGTFQEEAIGPRVQCKNTYRLETTVFILDSAGRSVNAAFLTVLELRAFRPERTVDAVQPSFVRLELGRIDLQGHVECVGGASLQVPLEGPPTIECGPFVSVPLTAVGQESTWDEVSENNRPPRAWRVAGTEVVNSTRCVKLVGEQHSEDWNEPRGDHTAWRRTDTVWMAPALGIAYRVERLIERREPLRQKPTQRSLTRYDLLNHITYSGPFYEDRRREIVQARRFIEEAAPYLRNPGQYEAPLAGILKKIAYHLDNQVPVEPYHKAILQVKRRIEAARSGLVSPDPPSNTPEVEETNFTRATLGRPAPDFVATDLINQESVRLQRLLPLGRPILMVFFKPNSWTASEVLHFGADKHRLGVTVLGMAVGGDTSAVRKQHSELGLKFPILSGKGFNLTYGVDATPRFVLLDAHGLVRGSYTGWGSETAQEINRELERLRKSSKARGEGAAQDKISSIPDP
jgi:hypothetical protein